MILGVGVAYVADRSGALVEWVAQSRWLGPTFNILAGAAVAATALHLYRSLRSSRAQLRRLIALHDAFKQERESSLSDD